MAEKKETDKGLDKLFNMANRVALVTGTGNADGIGAALARALAERGVRLVVSATTDERAKTAAKSIATAASVSVDSVVGIGADLMDPKAAWNLVEKTVEVWGSLDIVVNTAGTGVVPPRNVEAMKTPDELQCVCQTVFGVNVFGPLHVTRAATPHLKKSKAGRIINISSVGAQRPVPSMSVYGASKAALDSFTQTLAVELAPHKITVNSVLPGPFETVLLKHIPETALENLMKQVPLARMGVPYEDLGGVVIFLASDAGAYTTGAKIKVSGGMWV